MKRFWSYFLSFFPVLCLGVLIKSWALKVLWGWFLTPFFNLPAPPMAYCYGMMLIVAVINYHKC